MNEVEQLASDGHDLIARARNAKTDAERGALHDEAQAIVERMRTIADRDFDEHAYLHEKATQFEWHAGAALGFGETNGHPADQHRVWALGAMSSFEGHIDTMNRGEAG